MVLERWSRQSLGLDVSNVLLSLDILDLGNLLGNQVSDMMVANVEVLATLIMDVVLSQICCSNVVLVHDNRHLDVDEGLANVDDPQDLFGSSRCSHILGLTA